MPATCAPDQASASGERLTLRREAYDAIRLRILHGDLRPGQRTSERSIAEGLVRMSRTPVREALAVLEATGVVDQIPQVGVEVRAIELDDAIQVLRLRLGMESEIAAEAACRAIGDSDELSSALSDMREAAAVDDQVAFMLADTRLHREIARLAGFSASLTALQGMRDRVHLYRLHEGRRLTRRTMHAIQTEHAAVLAAIASGDPDAARRAMTEHLLGTAERLRAEAEVADSVPFAA